MPILKFGTRRAEGAVPEAAGAGRAARRFCLTEPQVGSDAAAHQDPRAARRQSLGAQRHQAVHHLGQERRPRDRLRGDRSGRGQEGHHGLHRADRRRPATIVARIEDKLGQRASDTCQIVFDDLRLTPGPDARRGRRGLPIALANLEGGRIGIAAQSVGMARAAFEAALAYAQRARELRQADHRAPGGRLPPRRHGDADRGGAPARAARRARCATPAQPCLTEASMAKLFASEMAERVCSDAIQIHGGYGYVNDFPVERIYRDVRVCQIYEGTSDIQRAGDQRSRRCAKDRIRDACRQPDRLLLRLLQPVRLPRLDEDRCARGEARARRRLAAVPARRRVQADGRASR